MCTLIASFDPDSPLPLVVAANRDERLDRASTPPLLWEEPLPFIAPRDEEAHGTWLGFNRAGLFVGVTNRFGVPKDPARASRGKLVLEALTAPRARALHQRLATLSPRDFNAFHLLYADRGDAFVTWSDGEQLFQASLPAGLHIVTERSLGGDDRARTETLRAAWKGSIDRAAPTVLSLHDLLSLQDPNDPVGSACVHLPSFNYGTRSSMILLVAAEPAQTRMYWAEGAPCTHPHVDQHELLEALAKVSTGSAR